MSTADKPLERPASAPAPSAAAATPSAAETTQATTHGGRRARQRLADGTTGRLLAECVRKAAVVRVYSRIGAFDGARLSMHAADHNETVLVFDIRRAELRKVANALLAAALLGGDDE